MGEMQLRLGLVPRLDVLLALGDLGLSQGVVAVAVQGSHGVEADGQLPGADLGGRRLGQGGHQQPPAQLNGVVHALSQPRRFAAAGRPHHADSLVDVSFPCISLPASSAGRSFPPVSCLPVSCLAVSGPPVSGLPVSAWPILRPPRGVRTHGLVRPLCVLTPHSGPLCVSMRFVGRKLGLSAPVGHPRPVQGLFQGPGSSLPPPALGGALTAGGAAARPRGFRQGSHGPRCGAPPGSPPSAPLRGKNPLYCAHTREG